MTMTVQELKLGLHKLAQTFNLCLKKRTPVPEIAQREAHAWVARINNESFREQANNYKSQAALYVNTGISGLSTISADTSVFEVRRLTGQLANIQHDFLELIEDGEGMELPSLGPNAETTRLDFQMSQYRDAGNALVRAVLSKQIHIGSAPVITASPMDMEKLKRARFSVQNFSRYAVLMDQTILGISELYVSQQLDALLADNDNDHSKSVQRKKTDVSIEAAQGEAQKYVIQHTLETVLGRFPNFEILSERTVSYRGHTFFWLSPKSRSSALIACASSPQKLASTWTFPFVGGDVLRRSGIVAS